MGSMCTCLATIRRIFLTLLSMEPIIISVVSAKCIGLGEGDFWCHASFLEESPTHTMLDRVA